jgi:hypothetical protein
VLLIGPIDDLHAAEAPEVSTLDPFHQQLRFLWDQFRDICNTSGFLVVPNRVRRWRDVVTGTVCSTVSGWWRLVFSTLGRSAVLHHSPATNPQEIRSAIASQSSEKRFSPGIQPPDFRFQQTRKPASRCLF